MMSYNIFTKWVAYDPKNDEIVMATLFDLSKYESELGYKIIFLGEL